MFDFEEVCRERFWFGWRVQVNALIRWHRKTSNRNCCILVETVFTFVEGDFAFPAQFWSVEVIFNRNPPSLALRWTGDNQQNWCVALKPVGEVAFFHPINERVFGFRLEFYRCRFALYLQNEVASFARFWVPDFYDAVDTSVIGTAGGHPCISQFQCDSFNQIDVRLACNLIFRYELATFCRPSFNLSYPGLGNFQICRRLLPLRCRLWDRRYKGQQCRRLSFRKRYFLFLRQHALLGTSVL